MVNFVFGQNEKRRLVYTLESYVAFSRVLYTDLIYMMRKWIMLWK